MNEGSHGKKETHFLKQKGSLYWGYKKEKGKLKVRLTSTFYQVPEANPEKLRMRIKTDNLMSCLRVSFLSSK